MAYITYFDEVKYQKGKQPYEWLAGIMVDATLVPQLEREVGQLSEACFRRSTMDRGTRFHAAALFNRAENFKKWSDVAKRLEVLKRLLKIVDNPEAIFKIYVRLDPALMMAPDDLAEKAFMFFVERVDQLVTTKMSVGLLIGDAENDRISGERAQSLSGYRQYGTPYEFGRELQSLIDTVHFTHSHLSRMLQLADVYAWALQLCASVRDESSLRGEMATFIRRETRLLQPHKYKEWPTAESRLKPAPK